MLSPKTWQDKGHEEPLGYGANWQTGGPLLSAVWRRTRYRILQRLPVRRFPSFTPDAAKRPSGLIGENLNTFRRDVRNAITWKSLRRLTLARRERERYGDDCMLCVRRLTLRDSLEAQLKRGQSEQATTGCGLTCNCVIVSLATTARV